MPENKTDMQKLTESCTVMPNRNRGYLFIKRSFDIFASLVGLVVLFPLFLIVSAAIFIDDPGPVLFLQERIGKKDKIFKMYKFRSMVKNAEGILNQLSKEQQAYFSENFKLTDDPRITKVGKLIRRTSIDELPQLINVLVGDMSLIGPRPPLLAEREVYGEHLNKIMSVRPGMTGYWQVHGRNETDYAERINMQEYYIDNQSLFLDISILIDTFGAVLSGKGAE